MVKGGHHFNKYASRNPLCRILVARFLRAFDAMSARTGCLDALDCGCGEGYLSERLLAQGFTRVRSCDICPQMLLITHARGQRFHRATIETFEWDIVGTAPPPPPSPLVVCCEVLEHLHDPLLALKRLAACSTEWVLFSVPSEPLWRLMNLLRLTYLRDMGNTPGHIQHWSKRGFVRMLQANFDVVEVRSVLPWTFVLCRVPTPEPST